jgi:hypothetical protein
MVDQAKVETLLQDMRSFRLKMASDKARSDELMQIWEDSGQPVEKLTLTGEQYDRLVAPGMKEGYYSVLNTPRGTARIERGAE